MCVWVGVTSCIRPRVQRLSLMYSCNSVIVRVTVDSYPLKGCTLKQG